MEGNHLAAKALSAMFGGQTIYSEKEAREKAVVSEFQLKSVSIKDIFYSEPALPDPSTCFVPQYQGKKQKLWSGMIGGFTLGILEAIRVLKDHNQSNDRRTMTVMHEIRYGFHGSIGTGPLFFIPDSEYDPDYDYDFTNYKGDDTNCTRGDYSYKRPAGWNRKAVKVIKKYEDDVWLGQKGWRDGSSPGEWAVSYHGTKTRESVPSIVMGGYDNNKSVRQMYGDGIYSAPDPEVAEAYAKQFIYNGESYKCILQNRVKPQKTEYIVSNCGDGIYFKNPNEDDIRPYGICVKKI